MNTLFVPPRHTDFSYRVDYIGQERRPVLVVDNFIANAEALIEIAERYCHFNNSDYMYPGIQALVPDFYTLAIYTYLRDIICASFNIDPQKIARSKSLFAMVLTPPSELQPAQTKPHVDSTMSSQLAGIHYLCSPGYGGTSFYRHRATGFESLNKERWESYEKVAYQEQIAAEAKKTYMNGSDEHFEQIASYDAVFNRIIMYHSNSLHSGNIPPDFNFDPNPRTGRLTLTTFIQSQD